MKSRILQPTPGWVTWTFCSTLDRLLKEVGIATACGYKHRLELIQDTDGWNLFTYEVEEPWTDGGS